MDGSVNTTEAFKAAQALMDMDICLSNDISSNKVRGDMGVCSNTGVISVDSNKHTGMISTDSNELKDGVRTSIGDELRDLLCELEMLAPIGLAGAGDCGSPRETDQLKAEPLAVWTSVEKKKKKKDRKVKRRVQEK